MFSKFLNFNTVVDSKTENYQTGSKGLKNNDLEQVSKPIEIFGLFRKILKSQRTGKI